MFYDTDGHFETAFKSLINKCSVLVTILVWHHAFGCIFHAADLAGFKKPLASWHWIDGLWSTCIELAELLGYLEVGCNETTCHKCWDLTFHLWQFMTKDERPNHAEQLCSAWTCCGSCDWTIDHPLIYAVTTTRFWYLLAFFMEQFFRTDRTGYLGVAGFWGSFFATLLVILMLLAMLWMRNSPWVAPPVELAATPGSTDLSLGHLRERSRFLALGTGG